MNAGFGWRHWRGWWGNSARAKDRIRFETRPSPRTNRSARELRAEHWDMEPSPPPNWKAKHAWQEVEREGPSKRPAEKRVGDFHEIYALYDEATVREQASRCSQCPVPSCVTGCALST